MSTIRFNGGRATTLAIAGRVHHVHRVHLYLKSNIYINKKPERRKKHTKQAKTQQFRKNRKKNRKK
ncbi:MAG: hypothetical protein MI808_22050 [Pseudomonadales bacterium]|nr:hypothetical protein [Pseudomonadales bacterium]